MRNQTAQNKRKEKDVMKLLMSNYEVSLKDENNKNDMYVLFHGPKNSPYEGGIWKVHVLLPEQYPYKSPSIGFYNKMYHPNVDEKSGSICLDVINQTWSPMFDLINIFDEFLPQLLLYPNPSDPLNSEAAKLLQSDPDKYNKKIKDYVKKFASEDIIIDKDKHCKNNSDNNHENVNCINNNSITDSVNKDENKEINDKNKKNENENENEINDKNNSDSDDIKSNVSSVLSKPSLDDIDLDD